jgi:hypothetical protein
MSRYFVAAVCGLTLLAGAGLVAQSGSIRFVPSSPYAPKFAERWRPVMRGEGETKIVGTVIDIRQMPVAYVRVQLRSLITGTVQQAGDSDEIGEYSFLLEHPGTYVVEVAPDGQVVALSNAGSLARYETLRTVVQLPGLWNAQARAMAMPQSLTEFIGMSAATSMTAATLSIAVNTNIAPVDAGEPVSAVSQK